MRPILFQFGEFILPAWHTFYIIAAFITYFYLIFSNKKFYPEINSKHIANVYLFCYLGGYFGARIFSIFNDQPELKTIGEKFTAIFQLGPMTFYGGFIGAFICGSIYVYRKKLDYYKIIDMAVPASLLGLAVGRIGCFLNGDDYGIPFQGDLSALPWWVVIFPNHEHPIPRHPVQLYSTFAISIFILLITLNFSKIKSLLGKGSIGLLSVSGYSVIRFLIEYFRGDQRGWVIENTISTSQFISIIMFLIAISFLLIDIRKNKK